MRLSARNQFTGRIVSIEKGLVTGVVKIEVAKNVIITADVTNSAIEDLGLVEGEEAVAVIKSTDVMVGSH